MKRQTAEYRPIIQKYNHVRSKKITQSANGEVCTMAMPGCKYDSETTVWAHANYDFTGKGGSIKSSDIYGCYACQQCHDLYDGRRQLSGFTDDERQWYFWRAHVKSMNRLIELGIVRIE